MTEYGRGPGSEPWHPEDPLYGDRSGEASRPAGAVDAGTQHPQAQQQYDQYAQTRCTRSRRSPTQQDTAQG